MTDSFPPRNYGFNAVVPLLKMRLENEIIRKREAKHRRIETARSNDRYFQHWSVQNEKFEEWTSPRSAQLSHRQSQMLHSEVRVQKRREQLLQLYKKDSQLQQQELKALKEAEDERKWNQMQNQVQCFRQTKQLKLQEMASQNDHEKWRHSSKAFHQFESELRSQQQREMWERQVKEKEEEKKQHAKEKQLELEQIERLRQEHKVAEEQEHLAEKEKKMRWKNDLEEQMQQIKRKEAEAHAKLLEHQRLAAEKMALEEARDKLQSKKEEQEMKKRMGTYLTKQHLANLRLRSKQISSDLEADQIFADKLFPPTQQSNDKRGQQQDLIAYHQLLRKHKQLEEERLKQMELMFQEEARRMWDKREAEWEAERLARRKLMDEVISTQKKQIEDKMNFTNHEREQILFERQKLLEAMDQQSAEEKNYQLLQNQKKMQLRGQLEKQVQFMTELKNQQYDLEREEFELARQREKEWDEKHWAVEMERLKL